jgi:hypothetical protein
MCTGSSCREIRKREGESWQDASMRSLVLRTATRTIVNGGARAVPQTRFIATFRTPCFFSSAKFSLVGFFLTDLLVWLAKIFLSFCEGHSPSGNFSANRSHYSCHLFTFALEWAGPAVLHHRIVLDRRGDEQSSHRHCSSRTSARAREEDLCWEPCVEGKHRLMCHM